MFPRCFQQTYVGKEVVGILKRSLKEHKNKVYQWLDIPLNANAICLLDLLFFIYLIMV